MIGPPDVYDEFDPLQEKHRVLRGDFAGAMRETRICVVGSSFLCNSFLRDQSSFLPTFGFFDLVSALSLC
jgi:hypothetical protein